MYNLVYIVRRGEKKRWLTRSSWSLSRRRERRLLRDSSSSSSRRKWDVEKQKLGRRRLTWRGPCFLWLYFLLICLIILSISIRSVPWSLDGGYFLFLRKSFRFASRLQRANEEKVEKMEQMLKKRENEIYQKELHMDNTIRMHQER